VELMLITFQESDSRRTITFDVIMSLVVVCFLAMVSRLLADAGISIISVSTYLRDYIFMSEGNQRKSLAIIRRFLRKQRKLIRCREILPVLSDST
jgi:hypothetical protein